MASQDAKLILYTNHRCPWAHRAHIALEELRLPFEEVIIDLDTPRTPEYLKINPRGLVPALSYNGEIIIESGIVAAFLADAFPSHLVPASDAPGGALRRARIALFVDAYFSKFQSSLFKLGAAKTEAEASAVVDAAVANLVKEVEPLLADTKPYFGGSDKLTLAEVLSGSFVLRLLSSAKAGIYPPSLINQIQEKAPNFYNWAQAVSLHPSVTSIYDEEDVITHTKKRIEKLKAAAA
ncbi:thioredoxin-like protein [Lasiosphaeria miniovina]|uniref:Thioredoxin-like protein n=1 Tax=Lasiosphaeria miniovina TaxID=1954250 RepID=A0AA40AK19_9PEZI|nr:thioredoxin-like protein [Lasiosphaeria miniovina]KAK0717309.1 thioredoxin-like protein [Lasiosphaeria miniovina]